MRFDDHFIDDEGFDGQLHSDGGFGVISEGVLCEFGENVGLADTRVSNYDDFEHKIWFDVACHAAIIPE